MHLGSLSVGIAGSVASVGGASSVVGFAGRVGDSYPASGETSPAFFLSAGGLAGLAAGADVGIQVGVWLREPLALGANLVEGEGGRIIIDGPVAAFEDTLAAGFLHDDPLLEGTYWGVEAGGAVKASFGAGAYFDVPRLSEVLRSTDRSASPSWFQGLAVNVGVGGGVALNGALGLVYTHEIGRTGSE